jgi:hypothetical protein
VTLPGKVSVNERIMERCAVPSSMVMPMGLAKVCGTVRVAEVVVALP